jgi:hypothetical protein
METTEMKELSRDKKIENLLVLQAFFKYLPAEKLYPRLADWRNLGMWYEGPDSCGSAACVGGWVAVMPHFKKQGVTVGYDGAPMLHLRNGDRMWPSETSLYLFGDDLFQPNPYMGLSDRKVVMKRIKNALKYVIEGGA